MKKKDLKVPNTGIFYISPATPEEISELKKTLRKVKAQERIAYPQIS